MEQAGELDLRFEVALRVFQPRRFKSGGSQAHSLARLDAQFGETARRCGFDRMYPGTHCLDHIDHDDNHHVDRISRVVEKEKNDNE